VYDVIQDAGVFVLFSSMCLELVEVLPLYYTRQQVEWVFGLGKNYADLLPLCVASLEVLCGYLFLVFVVMVVFKLLQNVLRGSGVLPLFLFLVLCNLKCRVYECRVII